MAWLKSVGCDCPECGPDPCTAGCECTFSYGAGPMIDDSTYDVTGQFIIAHDLTIDVRGNNYCRPFNGSCDSPVLVDWRLRIWADGVLIYDSGWNTGNLSTSTTVPAGTTSLHFIAEEDSADVCESGCSGQNGVSVHCV